jgi:hypothetical protein
LIFGGQRLIFQEYTKRMENGCPRPPPGTPSARGAAVASRFLARRATDVSGINRNLCVRNGPTMCGDLGETRTPDHGITNSAHLPAEIPGHHIEGSGVCKRPAPRAESKSRRRRDSRHPMAYTSGTPVPWPFDGRARTSLREGARPRRRNVHKLRRVSRPKCCVMCISRASI